MRLGVANRLHLKTLPKAFDRMYIAQTRCSVVEVPLERFPLGSVARIVQVTVQATRNIRCFGRLHCFCSSYDFGELGSTCHMIFERSRSNREHWRHSTTHKDDPMNAYPRPVLNSSMDGSKQNGSINLECVVANLRAKTEQVYLTPILQ